MVIQANCKINLGLRVVRKRDDGYHELQTIMLPVAGLSDVVDVEPCEGGDVEFISRGIVIDCPAQKNICVRAAHLMQQRYGVGGMRITLDKRVPFGAGLGGGSSDATAVVIAINEIYGLGLDKSALVAIAAELGSDTPFFVHNTPQYCTGRGEIMEPIDVNLQGLWLIVAKPDEGVSTKEAYSGVRPSVPDTNLCELVKQPVTMWQGSVVNDFECHIFEAHPAIADIKQRMISGGAIYASMSGSGSAVFGIFDCEPKIKFPSSVFVHVEKL